MKRVFAPGCALVLYKPELAKRMLDYLSRDFGIVEEHFTCCHHVPRLEPGTEIVNTCPGCDRRYRQLYDGISTVSLWELLVDSKFPFPDYGGKEMAILDACPTRDQERVHRAIRSLLQKMNVKVVEPENTGTNSTCCGDSFYGQIPAKNVKALMKKRADEMPVEDVVVYCVSCSKSMYIGGKRPRYMVDLLFGEDTVPGVFEPDEWHAQVDKFIGDH